MWTADSLFPGISLGGSITGRVRYPVPPGAKNPDGTTNTAGATTFVGVPNVAVHVDTNTSTHAIGADNSVAMTQPDGTFTLSDPLQNGQNAVTFDPLRQRNTIIDNIHQFPSPADKPDQMMDEPGATTFGCPACVHIHFRWSWIFKQENFTNLGTAIGGAVGTITVQPEALLVARVLASAIAANVLDPTFDNNDGFLKIPANSPQNVDVAILRSGGEEEQHLPGTVKDLFNSHGGQLPFGESILPSVLAKQAGPVLWYVASSNLGSDMFFSHGGGFGTFYANRISFPASGSGQPLALNIEHSRSVNYTVTPNRWDFTLVPGSLGSTPVPLPPVTIFSQAGALIGVDDIPSLPGPDTNAGLVFSPSTIRFTVDVTLDDPALAQTEPKHEWIRTFTFTKPDTLEP